MASLGAHPGAKPVVPRAGLWTLDQLKNGLSSHKNVKCWVLTTENLRRRERYFLLESDGLLGLDQDRDVRQASLYGRVMVSLPSKPGRQGEILKKFFFDQELQPQIELAVAAALETDHQIWELPEVASTPQDILKTADPRMAEDLDSVMNSVTAQIRGAVSEKRTTVFNSAELFLSVHDREQHSSRGLVHRSSQSRIYLEAAFSYSKGGESDEYLESRWAVNLDELGVWGLFGDTSERAERSLGCVKPSSGRYAVIVDAEVLATVLGGHLAQLSAANRYNGLPYVGPGSELIPELDPASDALTMTLDPTLPYGADSAAYSEQCIPQQRTPLVERNRVVGLLADKQYADYLNVAPTAVRGNLVIDPGTQSHEELTRSEPLVLEVLQFSGLFCDPNSGTYGSEIRLGRIFDRAKGTVTYVKGGSLSGSVQENFKRARFSNTLVRRSHFSSGSLTGNGYYGPSHALLTEVSVVG